VKYRRQFVLRHITSCTELSGNATALLKDINVPNAITWISKAWQKVFANTVKNCFRKFGFETDVLMEEEVKGKNLLRAAILQF
jgi:hypothetical protein